MGPKVYGAFPHQQEAAALRFHILTVSKRFVTRPNKSRAAFFLLGISLFTAHQAFAQLEAFQLRNSFELERGKKLASIIWEGGDDSSDSSFYGPELGEPPSGPPIWENASEAGPAKAEVKAAPPLEAAKRPAEVVKPASEAAKRPAEIAKPAPPKPSESVVTENGKVQLPSPERIAGELGYNIKEFKRYVDDFATSISAGPHSAAFRRLCARDEDSCRLLADFQAQALDAKRERRRVSYKVKHFRITEANVDQAQRFDFRVLTNNLKIESVDRLLSLAEHSFREVECPRNLSAALAIKAEEFFPNPKARSIARDLFEHGRGCLSPEDEVFERLYLRFGLHALYEGNKIRARDYLSQALRSVKPTERYRVLYWLGRIMYENQEGVGKENTYWAELLNQYPLSYYAIEVALNLGKDPIDVITQRKVGGLKREVANDPELNRMIRWLEALYAYRQSNAVAKWASWIVRANEGELDVDVLLYLSSLKIASGLYRSNIQMLFSYFRKNPAALNGEGLKLLYPRPYFDLIQEASKGKIDPFLVMGLVRQESGFDSRAISRAKAKGLMQIIPQTARRLASQGHRKLLNEKENTKMGVKYLLQLSDDFGGNVELVLAAYNAGPHRVTEWLRRNPDRRQNPLLWNDLIPYMETRDYVVSIVRNNYLYLRLYGGKDSIAQNAVSSELVRSLLSKAH